MDNINLLIKEGYELLENENVVEACTKWLKAWDELKVVGKDMEVEAIEELEEKFEDGIELLSNWVQDLEMELENAGLEDKLFFSKRRDYVKEFYNILPKSDDFIIMSMKLAEAESSFEIGEVDESEILFSGLAKDYNKSIWPFLKWGDVYCLSSILRTRKDLINVNKSLEVYKKGLGIEKEFDYILEDRIKDLEKINSK